MPRSPARTSTGPAVRPVEIRVGRAHDSLPELAAENRGPFDFVFIDADKPSNPDYLAWSLRLPGRTLIVADNVIRKGAVVDAAVGRRERARRAAVSLRSPPRSLVDVTAIQTVGSKGYDGFAIAIVG